MINEKGQEFSLMDIDKYCLLTDPEGLGISYETEFQRINNSYIKNKKVLEQGVIGGTLNFISYENYKSFCDFVTRAESLKFKYKIPNNNNFYVYYRDVNFKSITKSEKKATLSEAVIFEALTLWYKENNVNYNMSDAENTIRWDFRWDSRFVDYEHRNTIVENKGHVDAPIFLEIEGYTENPSISIYRDDELLNKIDFHVILEEGEKLQYCTQDNNLYIYKIGKNGEKNNLNNTLDLNNENNFFKIPIGVSVVKLTADTDITKVKLTIYEQYIGV